jgi:DNA adenine methylase
LKPIYKWTGGKRKDIKHIIEYFPEYINSEEEYTFIEPFFGGGAVYWYLENDDNIINDIDEELINFLNVLKTNSIELFNMVDGLSLKIQDISEREKNSEISIPDAKTERGLFYYEWRNKDRKDGLKKLSKIDKAFRFYIVNQLSFNGMRRFNSRGEFNIPYGNYKSFNRQFEEIHIEHLKNTNIRCGDYKDIIKKKRDNTFVFIDPPYTREFKEYSHENNFGNKEQIELSELFKSSECDIMIVINGDDFTRKLYDGYIKNEYDFKYTTNIKNRYSNDVKHLIITNY